MNYGHVLGYSSSDILSVISAKNLHIYKRSGLNRIYIQTIKDAFFS